MPGILGIVKKQISNNDRRLYDNMLQSMMHETFYSQSSYLEPRLGWYIGSVAIKGSYADNMPVYNKKRDLALFLAGECFFDAPIVSNFKSTGPEADPKRASYLLHLYEQEGLSFIRRLNGWFSCVLLDIRNGYTFLFNDRYGIQRIYYYEDSSGFYFASEAKALLKALPILRIIDKQSIAEYLCFDCVLNNRTYFSNVELIPGGSIWQIQSGIITKKRYFDLAELEKQPPLGTKQFLSELADNFSAVLPRYLAGDGVGIAITGGLDTRLIMSSLPIGYRQLKTFTYGGMFRDSMDVCLGRKVSSLYGFEHHTIRLEKQFLLDYSKHLAEGIYITDGLADATDIDELYLSNLVRNIATIKLTGKFGSQVLGRVRRALRNRLPDMQLINPAFRDYVVSASEALKPSINERDLSFVLFKEIPWYWARSTVAEMSQLMVRSPYLDNDFISLIYRAQNHSFNGSKFEINSIANNNRRLLDIRTNLGFGGKIPSIISKTIETAYKIRANTDKALNWDILPYSLHHFVNTIDTRILSPLHINRLILGFEYFRHYNKWFRHELASYLSNILLDERTLERIYWNSDILSRMVKDHISGRGRYLSEIRKVLTIEMIHRVLVEDIK
jgi:asparagine synthase (glutamine-hydrolysing)